MYPAGAEAGPNRGIRPGNAVGRQSSGELALVPARSAQPQTHQKEAVAIIPEMRWEDLTDEALIARYRAEAGQASAEQYLNELFRRHHVKVARWCLSVTGRSQPQHEAATKVRGGAR